MQLKSKFINNHQYSALATTKAVYDGKANILQLDNTSTIYNADL